MSFARFLLSPLERLFLPFEEEEEPQIAMIPPGEAFVCLSCQWTCQGVNQGHCHRCGSASVEPTGTPSFVVDTALQISARQRVFLVPCPLCAKLDQKRYADTSMIFCEDCGTVDGEKKPTAVGKESVSFLTTANFRRRAAS